MREWIERLAADIGLTFVASALGRLLWHVRKVQHRERDFVSLHLLWELITAVAMGFVAAGFVETMGWTGRPAVAVIVIVSYLGPVGIERALWWAAERWAQRP